MARAAQIAEHAEAARLAHLAAEVASGAAFGIEETELLAQQQGSLSTRERKNAEREHKSEERRRRKDELDAERMRRKAERMGLVDHTQDYTGADPSAQESHAWTPQGGYATGDPSVDYVDHVAYALPEALPERATQA